MQPSRDREREYEIDQKSEVPPSAHITQSDLPDDFDTVIDAIVDDRMRGDKVVPHSLTSSRGRACYCSDV